MQYKAKKRFGQNFLKDKSYLYQIIQSIPKIYDQDQIVEIGVGLGDLSDELLKLYPLKAYEIDSDLCSLLREKYKQPLETGRLELINQDVMKIDRSEGWLHSETYILVSNLPYYVATPIILKAMRDPLCKGFVVMTQKEVAQKFCAKSGMSDFCALSVLSESLGSIDYLFDVPASAFEPAPKVTSAVFRIKKDSMFISPDFEKFLKIAFCSPRKKLFKNLVSHYDKDQLQGIFIQCQINENARSHELSTSAYHQIFNHLKG